MMSAAFTDLTATLPTVSSRGRGMVQGLVFADAAQAARVSTHAFEHGLLVETSGPRDEVVKLLPPLTATDDEIAYGVRMLADAATAATNHR